MGNEPSNTNNPNLDNLMGSVGKLGQMQIDLIAGGIKSATEVFEPLSKTAVEIADNAVQSFSKILQDISSSIAQKQ